MNRLAASTSPYLLQHADNPVDWYEWGDEAFAEAEDRDVPVFLSVGYSACHWCHVMAHESFEDAPTAQYLNEHFVSVKVDREERPDVDAVYMEATQAMTGHGGWPMTCFLTPDRRPFFAGTYFPNESRHGLPSFLQVASAIAAAWKDRRGEIVGVAADIARRLASTGQPAVSGGPSPSPSASSEQVAADAVASLAESFDAVRGGFGRAPKFPPSMVCDFLLRYAARTGDERAAGMAARTLEAMARGGIFDQLGGGFARYSVDADWIVPHFEKMLYDNALLLRTYVRWYAQGGSALAERTARQTADFLLRELRTPEGGFASALDADSEGVEGKYYVWTRGELEAALGPRLGAQAAALFDVSLPGNVESGSSTLRLLAEPGDLDGYLSVRELLLEARGERVRPGRDDKVVTSWNGLAVGALAEASIAMTEPRYLEAARDAAELMVDCHRDRSGRLLRVSRDGVGGRPAGMLDDHGALASGLLTLYAATGDDRWFTVSRELVELALEHFGDGAGGYFDSPDDADALFKRPQDPSDNATPSGQSLLAEVLVTLGALTGESGYSDAAERLLARLRPLGAQFPRFAGHSLAVGESVEAGPVEIAVVGASGSARQALLEVAFEGLGLGAAVATGSGTGNSSVALVADRPLRDGRATAYVCHGFVCQRPVVSVPDLREQLGRPR